ncbi:bifunctional 2-polyprenyl-6-hydroxyphenol methylase/3-demethylubiquinol 3-O-methyltransferase UbiG [Kamptonema cortianum]|nr:bifunctional 2-polyprenyl-6-hydroxyphenol methylase/3-demethylubiquinol 3-O-methyltransferase UbiG [Geitlerinema splendidum]MDK3160901.1 bifunctional 2-polyprenyl-6-hydroxyphenol methylase/3-demethylubiquinol 3-O-methyltransferase UbiG [Kamptonema cortianum]
MTLNTRNKAELEHFKTHSATWWDEEGSFRVLHEITPLRMSFVKEKICIHFNIKDNTTQPLKGLRILDVGCGGGLLCEPLARLGANVTGIDPVKENIKIAKMHAKAMGLKITYLASAVEDLSTDMLPFDVIVASEIIEHVDHPDAFLKACVARLAPQGGMVVTTFNRTFKSYFFGIVAAEYILKWAPSGTHTWEKFMKPEELSKKLVSLGLGNQEVTGVRYSPFTRRWEFSSSLDVNYFLWAGCRFTS